MTSLPLVQIRPTKGIAAGGWFFLSAIVLALSAFLTIDSDAQKKKPPQPGKDDPIHDPANAVASNDSVKQPEQPFAARPSLPPAGF